MFPRIPGEEGAAPEATLSGELEKRFDNFDPVGREDFEERAAILEFCGEMQRAEAEAQAYALVAGAVQ